MNAHLRGSGEPARPDWRYLPIGRLGTIERRESKKARFESLTVSHSYDPSRYRSKMSDEPLLPQQSPDGKESWDGERWQPVPVAGRPTPSTAKRVIFSCGVTILVFVGLYLVVIAVGSYFLFLATPVDGNGFRTGESPTNGEEVNTAAFYSIVAGAVVAIVSGVIYWRRH